MQRPGGLRREGGRNGPGLPRSFAEDPFFHQPEEFLRDFAPHHRRFGSSPRLLEDDDAFFPSPFDDPNFRSLPRRGAPLRQSERVSPQPQAGVERPVYVQRQQTTPTQSAFGQRSPVPPKGILKKEEPQRDTQNVTTVPVITVTEPIVEINNANPSSYTNGQLNPDKRERRDSSSYNEEPESGRKSPAASESTARNISGPEREFTKDSKEMPSAALNGEAGSEIGQYARKLSSDGCSDQLIHLLDEAERRVEQLRETANRMEQEKEELLDLINNIKLNTEILRLGEGERDDLNAAVDRILKRCRTVDVVVNTPRNDEQTRALEDVNSLIQGVVTKMHSDLGSCKDTVRRMLNACSPDEPDGPIDQRFQAKVVECTADDQKKIRRKLAQLITQIDRAERACMPIT